MLFLWDTSEKDLITAFLQKFVLAYFFANS